MKHFIACLFLVVVFALTGFADSAQAATYQVGPSRTLKKLQDVAPLLAPGNVFRHVPTQGSRMVRVGSNGTGETKGRYRFVNNTFILRQGQVSPAFEIFEGIDSLEVHNNVFYHPGNEPIDKVVLETRVRWVAGRVSVGTNNWLPVGSAMIPTGWTNTVFGTNPGFANLATLDLRPAVGSALIGAGNNAPASPAGHPFINPLWPPAFHPPLHALIAPGTAAARPTDGLIDIGAYEYTP